MSFTQDELQAFNTILDRRLAIHRRECERIVEQRMQALHREFEQSLSSVQQNILHTLPQVLMHQQRELGHTLQEKFASQLAQLLQETQHHVVEQQEQRIKQIEQHVEHTLAAQLSAIEQVVGQLKSIPLLSEAPPTYIAEYRGDVEGIEVQTEISWDDLVGIVDKALEARFPLLTEAVSELIERMRHDLTAQLCSLRESLQHYEQDMPASRQAPSMQGIVNNIEHLERIVESVQVAMNANYALLSNCLSHHLQLPSEQAHANGDTSPLPSAQEPHHTNNTTTLFPGIRERNTGNSH